MPKLPPTVVPAGASEASGKMQGCQHPMEDPTSEQEHPHCLLTSVRPRRAAVQAWACCRPNTFKEKRASGRSSRGQVGLWWLCPGPSCSVCSLLLPSWAALPLSTQVVLFHRLQLIVRATAQKPPRALLTSWSLTTKAPRW